MSILKAIRVKCLRHYAQRQLDHYSAVIQEHIGNGRGPDAITRAEEMMPSLRAARRSGKAALIKAFRLEGTTCPFIRNRNPKLR